MNYQYIHLQDTGRHFALPAKELRPGMTLVWNFGYTSVLKAIEPSKTGKTLTLTTKSEDGKLYTRKFAANTLIAVDRKYAEDYLERSYIDPRSREYLYDHGARIDNSSGMIYISRQQFDRLSHTDRSIHDHTKRTWMIPTTNGICLIIEGKHFTVTEAEMA